MKTKRNYKVKVRGYIGILCLVILLTLSLGYLAGESNNNKDQNPRIYFQQETDLSVTNNIYFRLIGMINQTKLNEFYVRVREMKLDPSIVELGLNRGILGDEMQVGGLIQDTQNLLDECELSKLYIEINQIELNVYGIESGLKNVN